MCTDCHGEDFGAKVYLDAGPLGIVVGPNLTRGQGGIGNTLTDADWVKAIRHGIRHDGASLLVMPSEKLTYLAEDDLAALVSYLKQLAPIDRNVPPSKIRFLGRTMMVLGKLPLLAAEKVCNLPLQKTIDRIRVREYGLYIANVASCRGCHRPNLAGGSMQAPGSPPAPNLTPAGIGHWSEADFVRTMRTGKRPGAAPNDALAYLPPDDRRRTARPLVVSAECAPETIGGLVDQERVQGFRWSSILPPGA